MLDAEDFMDNSVSRSYLRLLRSILNGTGLSKLRDGDISGSDSRALCVLWVLWVCCGCCGCCGLSPFVHALGSCNCSGCVCTFVIALLQALHAV